MLSSNQSFAELLSHVITQTWNRLTANSPKNSITHSYSHPLRTTSNHRIILFSNNYVAEYHNTKTLNGQITNPRITLSLNQQLPKSPVYQAVNSFKHWITQFPTQINIHSPKHHTTPQYNKIGEIVRSSHVIKLTCSCVILFSHN